MSSRDDFWRATKLFDSCERKSQVTKVTIPIENRLVESRTLLFFNIHTFSLHLKENSFSHEKLYNFILFVIPMEKPIFLVNFVYTIDFIGLIADFHYFPKNYSHLNYFIGLVSVINETFAPIFIPNFIIA